MTQHKSSRASGQPFQSLWWKTISRREKSWWLSTGACNVSFQPTSLNLRRSNNNRLFKKSILPRLSLLIQSREGLMIKLRKETLHAAKLLLKITVKATWWSNRITRPRIKKSNRRRSSLCLCLMWRWLTKCLLSSSKFLTLTKSWAKTFQTMTKCLGPRARNGETLNWRWSIKQRMKSRKNLNLDSCRRRWRKGLIPHWCCCLQRTANDTWVSCSHQTLTSMFQTSHRAETTSGIINAERVW